MKLKLLDVNQVLRTIKEERDQMSIQLNLINVSLRVIKLYDGKRATRHITNRLKKEIPTYTVTLVKSHGMAQIAIWGNNIHFNNRMTIFLAYVTRDGDEINFDVVLEMNRRYTLNRERIKHLFRAEKCIPDFVERWNAVLTEANQIYSELINDDPDASDHIRPTWPLSSIFRLDQERQNWYL